MTYDIMKRLKLLRKRESNGISQTKYGGQVLQRLPKTTAERFEKNLEMVHKQQ